MRSIPSLPSRTDQFVPPAMLVQEDAPDASVFWRIAFLCWLATVFILYSRFFDLALRGLHIPRIVLSLMFLSFVVSGRPLIFLRSSGGKIMAAFVFWVTFTLIFSVWKGGSLPTYGQLLLSTVFFAIAASLPNTISNAKKSHYALAFSGLTAALMSIPWGVDLNGRLALRDGSYFDPNYYAMGLLAVVPFFWEMAVSTKSKIVKLLSWLSMAPLFLAVSKAGSRGAMVGLGVMILLVLIISPLKAKIGLILVCAFGFATVMVTVPSYLRARYFTLFSIDSEAARQSDSGNPDLDRLRADVGSSEGRRILLLESVALTFEHPFVGVGPGNFQVAVFDEARAKGILHNEWMATHNSYTEISCETGFPGLILLLCLIGASFNNLRTVLRGAKPTGAKPDAAAYAAAKSLLLSMSVICTCVFFLAVGYDFAIYLWAGLTVALRRTYEQKRVADSLAVDGPEGMPQAKPVFAPSVHAKVADRLRPAETGKDSGRPIRFNRFR